jgi:hypothetical protein
LTVDPSVDSEDDIGVDVDDEDEDGNDKKLGKDDVGMLKGSGAWLAPKLPLVCPLTCTAVWA